MKSPQPIISGSKDLRSFEIYEPVRGEYSTLCRVVIKENGAVIWDQAIHGEDRNNAIRCGIKLLDGFFENLLLPPILIADAMDGGAIED